MNKKINYKPEDFKILKGVEQTGDIRMPYKFVSKDGKIEANFFWLPSDVQMRYIIWEKGLIVGSRTIAYPFANHRGGGVLPKDPSKILNSLILSLKRGDYKKVGA